MSVDRLRVFLGTSNRWLLGGRCSRVGTLFGDFEEAEGLGIKKRRWLPIAHLAVIADGYDIVLVVEADNRQTVDRVLMTVLCQAALLDWLRSILSLGAWPRDWFLFSSNIPFKQVASHSRCDDDVRVMRIEHCLCDFILAIQCQLWPALHIHTEDVNESIWLINVPLLALAIRG